MASALTLTKVTPSEVSGAGGFKVEIFGDFSGHEGRSFKVYIGTTDPYDPTDPLCLSGTPGSPQVLYPAGPTKLVTFLPVITSGTYHVSVVSVDGLWSGVLLNAITAYNQSRRSSVFSYRKTLPPYYKLGPRGVDTLPALPVSSQSVGILEGTSFAIGAADNDLGGILITRVTAEAPAPVAVTADYAWDGTVVVLTSDTSEVLVGELLRYAAGAWFTIESIDTDVSITLSNPRGRGLPTGSGAGSAYRAPPLTSATALDVVSTIGWPDAGAIAVDGVRYTYDAKTATQFSGLSHVHGDITVLGLRLPVSEAASVLDVSKNSSLVDKARRALLVE